MMKIYLTLFLSSSGLLYANIGSPYLDSICYHRLHEFIKKQELMKFYKIFYIFQQ